MSGVIACDIDGTLTDHPFHIPDKVKDALAYASTHGWELIFLTGRPFTWGARPFESFNFPFHLAVINGANLLKMPEKVLINEILIDKKKLKSLDTFCKSLGTDYVAYGGFTSNDICFYRPHNFSQEMSEYLKKRRITFGESWIPTDNYDDLPLDGFASIKCFGDLSLCKEAAEFMEKELELEVPVIRDPFKTSSYVAQATHSDCNKGKILRLFIEIKNLKGPIIAAGDDYNDISMLQMADKCIVMQTAPSEILAMGDIIASPASEGGIAEALIELMEKLKWKL